MKYIFLINRFSLKKNTEKMAEVIKKVCKRRKIETIKKFQKRKSKIYYEWNN